MTTTRGGLRSEELILKKNSGKQRLRVLRTCLRYGSLAITSKATLVKAMIRSTFEYALRVMEVVPELLAELDRLMHNATTWCAGNSSKKLVKRARVALGFEPTAARRWRAGRELLGRPYVYQVSLELQSGKQAVVGWIEELHAIHEGSLLQNLGEEAAKVDLRVN